MLESAVQAAADGVCQDVFDIGRKPTHWPARARTTGDDLPTQVHCELLASRARVDCLSQSVRDQGILLTEPGRRPVVQLRCISVRLKGAARHPADPKRELVVCQGGAS